MALYPISTAYPSATLYPGHPDPATPDITVAPSTLKISRVVGKDSTTFTFQVSQDYRAYELRVVPATGSPRDSGILLESGTSGLANTDNVITVTDDELVATGAGDGPSIVKLFITNETGRWSA